MLPDLNRHELIYQFDFSVISELTEDDTRQQDDLNSLDELRRWRLMLIISIPVTGLTAISNITPK